MADAHARSNPQRRTALTHTHSFDSPRGAISNLLVTSIDPFGFLEVGKSLGKPSDSAQVYFSIQTRYF